MQRAQQVAAGAETVRQVPTGKRKHGSGRDRAVRAVAEQLQAAPAPPEGFEACEHEGYLYNNTNRQYLHTESGIFLCNDQRGNQMYFCLCATTAGVLLLHSAAAGAGAAAAAEYAAVGAECATVAVGAETLQIRMPVN